MPLWSCLWRGLYHVVRWKCEEKGSKLLVIRQLEWVSIFVYILVHVCVLCLEFSRVGLKILSLELLEDIWKLPCSYFFVKQFS
jgi:hypothetical protein